MARTVPPWSGKTDDAMPPPSVTLRIFTRAKGKCQHCLRTLMAGEKWHRDHIVPLADGGANVESNFQILCDPCHGSKTAGENRARAVVRRKAKAAHGIKSSKAKIQGRGFAKKPARNPKPMPPVRLLYRRGELAQPSTAKDID